MQTINMNADLLKLTTFLHSFLAELRWKPMLSKQKKITQDRVDR